MTFRFIRFDFTLQIQAPDRASGVSACKGGRFSFTILVIYDFSGIWVESGVTTEWMAMFVAFLIDLRIGDTREGLDFWHNRVRYLYVSTI